jgi:hypothetical protein
LDRGLISVTTTDPREWLSPKHPLKPGRLSRISLGIIIGIPLGIHWFVRAWYLISYSSPTWQAMSQRAHGYIEDHLDQRLIRTILHIVWFITLYIIIWVSSWGPVILRCFVFFIFEERFIEYRIAEARRQRFARDSIEELGKRPKPSFAVDYTGLRSYQYPSLIPIATPLTIAGLLVGIGSWLVARGPRGNIFMQACHYLLGWPSASLGTTLFLEFTLRIWGEFLCRFPWVKAISTIRRRMTS